MIIFLLINYLLPAGSPLAGYIEYLEIDGLIDAEFVKPYSLDRLLDQFEGLVAGDGIYLPVEKKVIASCGSLLNKRPEFSGLVHGLAAYRTDSSYRCALDSRLGGRLGPGWSWNQGLRFDYVRATDPLGPKPWKDHVQAYLNEGTIGWQTERLALTVGRRNYLISHGTDQSLIFSPAKEGYDGYCLFLPLKYFDFQTIFSILDSDALRFISLHRIGLNLKNFSLGFSESILFSGNLEPLYLNFLLPYYLEQWGLGRDDNITWLFDLRADVFNTVFYAELLVDDYMYENDPYPDKLAYQAGAKSLLRSWLLIKFDYAFVDKWVYTHEAISNVYENRGYPIGFPLGNDCDRFSLALKAFTSCGVSPKFEADYVRRGEGSIYLPYEVEGGPWSPPFPSGIVERTLRLSAGLQCQLFDRFFLDASLGRQFIENSRHQLSDDNRETLLGLYLWTVL